MYKRKANNEDNYDLTYLDEFSNKKRKTEHGWVSGTTIANYLNGEPLIDWLNLYYNKYGFNNKRLTRSQTKNSNSSNSSKIINSLNNRNTSKVINISNKSDNPLLNNGLLFEKTIYDKLEEKFPNHFQLIASDQIDFETHYKDTLDAIENKVPIIAQAVLVNNETKMRGIADILVRSDFINKIFKRQVIDKTNYKKNNKYYYVVVDIKWTSMTLCADGETIRNDGRFKSYKGQLLIYNYILGKIQNYTPDCAYIMAKNWKIDKKNNPQQGFSCFDLLGKIDYVHKDNQFIKSTYDAIDWIWNVRENGLSYTPLDPQIKEMCVNASNQNDNNWGKVKKEILNVTRDITAIWQLTPKHRNIAFDKNIRRWDDKKCTTKNLEMNTSKKAIIVDKILEINRQNHYKVLPNYCDEIKDNRLKWKTKYPTDFFVDFETISEQLSHLESVNITDSRMKTQIIFMIGVGYEYNEEFHYRVFKINNFTLDEEKRILQEFKTFIDTLSSDLDPSNKYYPRLFHWSNAEKSMLESAFQRHHSLVKQWNNHLEWIDLCDIFTSEPIVVKGALCFKLKEVANALFSHGLITTYWETSDVSDGLSAMTTAIEYYNKIHKTEEDYKKMEAIVKYNKIDCRALWDILNCIRTL
jgi:hypothetical protein